MVKKGVVDFIDPYRINPEINIEGEAKIRDWDVFLTISGTPEDLRFKLTSDPHEEHGDIVSLLVLTGQRRGEIANLSWSEIDGDRLVLPSVRTKNKRGHVLPLGPKAVELLNDIDGGTSERRSDDTLTKPKSVSRAVPSESTRILEGLTSR